MATLAIAGGTPVRTDPFTKWPIYGDAERQGLLRAFDSGNWGGYPSPNVEAARFAGAFARHHGAKHGVCAANGTVTLQLALRAGGIGRGDEVIVPPFTFVATAASAIYVGATPVFADVRGSDYTIDPDAVEAAITPRTRAVICVHLGASVCDLDRLTELCKRKGLLLVEDCAHMHGARWRERGVGSWGDFGSFSFQSSKLMTAGEGGMILTNEARFEKRLQSMVNCGRREASYDDADIHWLGHNFRITELQAAILDAQLQRLEELNEKRRRGFEGLEQGLAQVPGVGLLEIDSRVTTRTGYQYIFRYDPTAWAGKSKERVLHALMAEGIPVYDGYMPLNREHELLPTPSLAQWYDDTSRHPKLDPAACPNADRAARESIWLPHQLFLGSEQDVDDIVAAVAKVAQHASEIP